MESTKKSGSIWGWGLILALAVNLIIWVPRAKSRGSHGGRQGPD